MCGLLAEGLPRAEEGVVTDTARMESFLPMPGDVHPSLAADSWAKWSGLVERGTIFVPPPVKPAVLYEIDEVTLLPPPTVFTLRKAFGTLDPRFGGYWWWPRIPNAWAWGTGHPLPNPQW